jgi:hypothetical protein
MLPLRVFDPAMCCSSGVCGPSVDPRLVSFAADLDWLRRHGVSVERFNLAQAPGAFVADAAVKSALAASGTAILPLIEAGGEVVSEGRYPSLSELAVWVGLEDLPERPLYTPLPQGSAGRCCGSSQLDLAPVPKGRPHVGPRK